MSQLEVSLALIERSGRWFLQRRDPGAEVMPGLWEFPGGKVEPREDPCQALRRELQEELGWTPGQVTKLTSLSKTDGGSECVFHLFHCVGPAHLGTHLAWGWFTKAEIRALPSPPFNASLLSLLDRGRAGGPPC